MSSVNEQRVAGPALNAEIAERVMGFFYEDADGTWRREGFFQYLGEELPRYSTDIAAASLVEAEIERRGLGREYAAQLAVVVLSFPGARPMTWKNLNGDAQFKPAALFRILRATPEQRCLAALAICNASLSIPSADRASQNEDK